MASDELAHANNIIGTKHETRTTKAQQQAARRAIVWRYLNHNWTMDDLRTVLDALDLGNGKPARPVPVQRILSPITYRDGKNVILACGHKHRLLKPSTTQTQAVCPQCSAVA